ncbi:unnamed protein product [marine sediment metagenome]|uniref:Uncharacterized protein n=1 Tax=marine sediment metagenome TaxID=412755 RepID=X1ET17_9ZZZZ
MEERPNSRRLEAAATLLIEQLPSYVRDLIIELADMQFKCPRWHLMAGYALRMFEQGQSSDFTTEPHWASEKLEPEPSTCRFCEEIFMPVRLGQIFCAEKCAQGFTEHGVPKSQIPTEVEDGVDSDSVRDTGDTVEPGTDEAGDVAQGSLVESTAPPKTFDDSMQDSANGFLAEITG